MESDVAVAWMTHANMPSANICVCVLEGARPRIHAGQDVDFRSRLCYFFFFFWWGWACGKFEPISCLATDATKHMCVRSPKQWANQRGASTDMKAVIKTRLSHGWRCGEASTGRYGRRLKGQLNVYGMLKEVSLPVSVKPAGLLPLSYSLLPWHVHVCFHAFLSICAQGFCLYNCLYSCVRVKYQETNLPGGVNTLLWAFSVCSCTLTYTLNCFYVELRNPNFLIGALQVT